jgi:hypothetical protein
MGTSKGTEMEVPIATPAPAPATPPVPSPDPEPAPAPAPAPAPIAQPGEPAAKVGDDDAAVKRIQADRDALKAQVVSLEQKLAEAKTAEDIEAAKKAAKDEANLLVLDKSIDVALIQAGCVNTKATKALIDTTKVSLNGDALEGLDIAALIKDNPYLFSNVPTVSTGAPSAGPADKAAAELAAFREAGGLPPEKKE